MSSLTHSTPVRNTPPFGAECTRTLVNKPSKHRCTIIASTIRSSTVLRRRVPVPKQAPSHHLLLLRLRMPRPVRFDPCVPPRMCHPVCAITRGPTYTPQLTCTKTHATTRPLLSTRAHPIAPQCTPSPRANPQRPTPTPTRMYHPRAPTSIYDPARRNLRARPGSPTLRVRTCAPRPACTTHTYHPSRRHTPPPVLRALRTSN
ncbi:hypothetical protein V8E53_003783 [Lactarius tabidus]